MSGIESSPTFLAALISGALFCGIVIFIFGRKLPGKGSWFAWAGIVGLGVGVGLDSGLFLKEEFRTKIWMSGWIWPKNEIGAIRVGVFQDPIGLVVTLLAAIVASALLLNRGFLAKEPRSEKVYAALLISTAGVALSWNSLT